MKASPSQPADSDPGFVVSVQGTDLDMEIQNDTSLFNKVSDAVRGHLQRVSVIDEETRLEVITALEESLANAMVHGNLELPSDTRRDPAGFLRLIAERQTQSPYCLRRVRLQLRIANDCLEIKVRDEGPGFDSDRVPIQPGGVAPWGNGLVIIRAFMDDVRHNAKGNEITMIRRISNSAIRGGR